MWPVKWEKLNDLQWSPANSKSHILTIEAYSENDFGEYKCSSRNSIGQSEITLHLNQNHLSIDESLFKTFPKSNTDIASHSGGGVARMHHRRKSGLELRKNRFRNRLKKIRRFKQKKSLLPKNNKKSFKKD